MPDVTCVRRWRFLLESLEDLDKSLQAYGTRLYVAKGQPLVMLEKLCACWNVQSLTYQVDKDVDSNILEVTVDALASRLGISVNTRSWHNLEYSS